MFAKVSKESRSVKMSNTPYDDVFRTLLNDCSSLIIPIINEVFGEHYTGNEEVIFSQNEHFLNQQDGNEEKRVTDSSFKIIGAVTKKYHCECQATPDNTMLIRIFEYGSQIALDDGEIKDNILTVTFPHSVILFLRHNQKTPDRMRIRMETPGGSVEYEVPVMKTRNYTLDEIFNKKLLFLLPFYIFLHEGRFSLYNRDDNKLDGLKEEYEIIKDRLEELQKNGGINEFTRRTIIDMSNKVLENIAQKYENVIKGVKEAMGGQILEYETKTIFNAGKREVVENMIRLGKISFEDIAKCSGLTLKEVETLAERLKEASAV